MYYIIKKKEKKEILNTDTENDKIIALFAGTV